MATLTVNDDVVLKVDEFAKKEELSRDELVERAIRVYLNGKIVNEMRELRREYIAQHGAIAEEDINEEIRKYKEEKRLAGKDS
jgi:metal-responsive CopG/Arc/MetJ family transcriptional regulator